MTTRPIAQHSYETHQLQWRGLTIAARYCADWFPSFREVYGYGMAHLEISAGHPLPITGTGYRSHFIPAPAIDEEGGPVAFVTAWLDHAAALEGWNGAQLSLF